MIIRSKISSEVLHLVFRKEDFKNGRVDILLKH